MHIVVFELNRELPFCFVWELSPKTEHKDSYSLYSPHYRSGGLDLTRYVVPWFVEDGAWMPWENSSVVAVVAAVHAQS